MTHLHPKRTAPVSRGTRRFPSSQRSGPRRLSHSQRQSLTYPGGLVLTNNYTARGQLAALTFDGSPPLVTYTYDARGQRTMRAYENGTTAYYTNDAAGQLLALAHVKTNNGNVLVQVNYGYNEVGNLEVENENY